MRTASDAEPAIGISGSDDEDFIDGTYTPPNPSAAKQQTYSLGAATSHSMQGGHTLPHLSQPSSYASSQGISSQRSSMPPCSVNSYVGGPASSVYSGGSGGGGGSSSTVASSSAQSAASSSNTNSTAAGGKKKKRRVPTKKVLNVGLTKYPVIREVADDMGFTLDDDDEVERFEFNLIWSDTTLPLQKLVRLQNWQRTNHFPSMHLLTRKVHLGLTLGRIRKAFPAHYTFVPRTWSLRSEKQQFQRYFNAQTSRKVFILKPNAGCQGRGILLSKDPLNAVEDHDAFIVQEYVCRPLLIEGKKFDLRVYALVSSIRHLSVFIYNEGLVRMCAEGYEKPSEENLGNICKHLTNYAVNKHSDQFVFNEDKEGRGDSGNKRDFSWFNSWLTSEGNNVGKFWEKVEHIICKSIIAAVPQMTHVYNSCFPHNNDGFTCFEVLGFDILVDEKCKPWLMEINHTPSLTCDTPLDHRIKHALITETWNIVNIQPTDKQRHIDRERAQFAKRMQQVKNVHNVNTTLGNAQQQLQMQQIQLQQQQPPSVVSSPMIPIDQMFGTSVPQQSDQLTALGIVDEAMLSTEQFVEEHRRKEDAKATNYRRIYPSNNIQLQMLYERILVVAKSISSIPTTAAQEQRQTEIRAEREKRENTKGGRPLLTNVGGGAPQPGSAPSGGESSQQPHSSRAYHSAPTPPQHPARAESANSNRSTPSLDEMLASQPFVRAMVRQGSNTVTPPSVGAVSQASNGSNGSKQMPRSAPVLSQAEKDRPKRTKEEVEKQRQRLAEQMERHRRRMVLGPRLSVFQLREAQLAAMFDEDGNMAQPPTDPNGMPVPLGAVGVTVPSKQQLPVIAGGTVGAPGGNAGGTGGSSSAAVSSFASQQEQFQAILDQLSKYHIASEYYPSYDISRHASEGQNGGARGASQQAFEDFCDDAGDNIEEEEEEE